jgi:hypothetical protein
MFTYGEVSDVEMTKDVTRKQIAAALHSLKGFSAGNGHALGRVRMIGNEWITGRVLLNGADDDVLAIENENALMMVAIRYITAIEIAS